MSRAPKHMPKINGLYKYPHPNNPKKLVSRQRVEQVRRENKDRCSDCGGLKNVKRPRKTAQGKADNRCRLPCTCKAA